MSSATNASRRERLVDAETRAAIWILFDNGMQPYKIAKELDITLAITNRVLEGVSFSHAEYCVRHGLIP